MAPAATGITFSTSTSIFLLAHSTENVVREVVPIFICTSISLV